MKKNPDASKKKIAEEQKHNESLQQALTESRKAASGGRNGRGTGQKTQPWKHTARIGIVGRTGLIARHRLRRKTRKQPLRFLSWMTVAGILWGGAGSCRIAKRDAH